MNRTAANYLRAERRGMAFALAAFAAMIAVPMAFEWVEHREIARQRAAPVYAAPWDVSSAIEGGALHFTGLTRKLEDCTVPKGAAVTLAAEIADGRRANAVRGYEALHPTGEKVLAAPLVTKDREFAVGPFVILDRPEVLARIVSVTVVLPCDFLSTGVHRRATIGPIEIAPARD